MGKKKDRWNGERVGGKKETVKVGRREKSGGEEVRLEEGREGQRKGG